MLVAYIMFVLTLTCDSYDYRYQNKLHTNIRTFRSIATRRVLSLLPSKPSPRRPHSCPRNCSAPAKPNFNNTYFCPMPEMAQSKATVVDESEYPWLARVIAAHYRNPEMAPLLCTAAAVSTKVFLTAARCIATAKAEFTTILYQKRKMGVRVFITSLEPTKQLFDDIGVIVSWAPWDNKTMDYVNISLPMMVRGDDDPYDFFEKWAEDGYSVIGFIASEKSPTTQNLYRLDNMHGSNRVCNRIYPMTNSSRDYWAPCVHSCTLEEHWKKSERCRRYQIGLGHMVIDKQNELVGVVTWTCGNAMEDRLMRGDLPLPLGIAVPNKKTLQIDLKCAVVITMDQSRYDRDNHLRKRGYYREVCVNYY